MNTFVKDMLMSRYQPDQRQTDRRGFNDHNRSYYNGDYRKSDMRESDYAYDQRRYDSYPRDYERDFERGDYARGNRDYHNIEYGKLHMHDIDNWSRSLLNSDGTRGAHFHKEHLEQIAKNMGINVDHFGGMHILLMATNMMYADYCAVAKKYGLDRLEFYVCMAKAFLEDKDFKGNPEEKLWLYYMCIAKSEN